MLRLIDNHRALSQLLCGLVFIALWNNAAVWAFCPHTSATLQSCLNEESSSTHHGGMATPGMDEEDLIVSNVEHECATSSDRENSTAHTNQITALHESCSHCVMHSQPLIYQTANPLVLNNSSSHGIVPAVLVIVPAPVVLPPGLIDVYDHGPPGLNSSRYILNGSFRI
jgi:hypothetical protein